MRPVLTAEQLRAAFDYDASTGAFSVRGKLPKRVIGQSVGHLDKSDGYIRMRLYGRSYKAHRLAWLHVYGEWPNGILDHINQCKTDNRISNLRLAGNTLNLHNISAANKNSSSGIRGVSPKDRGWRAQVWAHGKRIYLGTFADKGQAEAAYLVAKAALLASPKGST